MSVVRFRPEAPSLYFAGVAQLAEQLICNQQVAGSIPVTSSIFFGKVPEWPKGTDCKSVVSDFGGSNPPLPTKINHNIDTKNIGIMVFLLPK